MFLVPYTWLNYMPYGAYTTHIENISILELK